MERSSYRAAHVRLRGVNALGDPARSFPEAVGRYEIALPIASGGMATVYLARARGAEGFSRLVALKLVHEHLRAEPAFLSDLVEEAKIAGKLHHPNVVPVLDVGQDRLGTYLVMEYVEGASLSGLFRAASAAGTRLSQGVTLRILFDALSGLHAAHELGDGHGGLLGVVHRDFSPQNILVGSDGIARLTDFGIAKARSRISTTRTGVTKGKLAYMSPEQARGKVLDRRADVWAAGVVAWELAARRRLFRGSEADVIRAVAHEPIPNLAGLDPDLPPEFCDAVANALSRDLERRTPTVKAFRDAMALGARGAWLPADTEQIAGTVEALLGSELAERRGQIARFVGSERGSTPDVERPAGLEALARVASDETVTLAARGPAPAAASDDAAVARAAAKAPAVGRWSGTAIGLALLCALLVSLAGLVLHPQRGDRKPASALAESTVGAVDAAPTPLPPTAPSPVTRSEPAPPSSAMDVARSPLVIESNLPLSKVEVDGVAARVERGTRRVEVAVSSGSHVVEVTSVNGRRLRLEAATSGRLRARFPSLPASRPLVKNPY